jgi:hypothetical protein
MDVHPIKKGIFIGIDPYPHVHWGEKTKIWNCLKHSLDWSCLIFLSPESGWFCSGGNWKYNEITYIYIHILHINIFMYNIFIYIYIIIYMLCRQIYSNPKNDQKHSSLCQKYFTFWGLLFICAYIYIYTEMPSWRHFSSVQASNMLMPFGKQIVAEFYKTESRLRRLCLYFAWDVYETVICERNRQWSIATCPQTGVTSTHHCQS